MKEKILFLFFLTTLYSCKTTQTKILNNQTNIVPIPKNVIRDSGKRGLVFTNSILFSTSSQEINTIVDVLEKDIESISSMDMNFEETSEAKADLVFALDKKFEDEEYSSNR